MSIEATVTNESVTFTATSGDAITIWVHDLNDSIRRQAMLHGLKQKVGDAAAISRNPDTGRSATDFDKLAAMQEVLSRLLSGQWNKVRGEGTGTGSGGLLFRALCMVYPNKTPEQLREFLGKKSNEEKHALRTKVPAIVAAIEEIKSKMTDDGEMPDTEALLGELDD